MRHSRAIDIIRSDGFNPRTHEGCDDMVLQPLRNIYQFQSTHPRGVRLVAKSCFSPGITFQSTHPRGVRLVAKSCFSPGITFQSTHPRGVRLSALCSTLRDQLVSIHAPTRGATFSVCPTRSTTSRFQSTHPRGVRHEGYKYYKHHPKFQSTHPRGVRLIKGVKSPPVSSFNPRTHEGCDFSEMKSTF